VARQIEHCLASVPRPYLAEELKDKLTAYRKLSIEILDSKKKTEAEKWFRLNLSD
jgi:hypothetical protein